MNEFRAFFDRVSAMAGKEVRHILRDRLVLAFALVMPVMLLLLFGYAISFDVENVPLVVVDQDHTADSRQLAERFDSAGTFQVVARRQSPEDVEPLFRRGVARAALVIPRGFGRERGRGGDAAAQFLLDGSDNTTASIALGYANTVALGATQASLAQILGRFDPPVELRARTFFNPRLQSAVVLVPGLMVIVLVMVCVMLTALTVAREYERGSMEQLFATPVGRLEIVLGKLAPYFLIGIADVLLVLAAGVLLFDVPVNGNLAILFVVASLFILAMFAQGLVISIVARSQMLASQMAMISTMLPAMLLSGFVFPIENMPLPLRIVARVMPARYLVHTLRSVMLRGNGWSVVWPDAVATAAFLAFMLLIATRRFRRSLG